MSQASLLVSRAIRPVPVPGLHRMLRVLLVAAVLSAAGGLAATALFMRSVGAGEAPGLAAVPSALPVTHAPGSTGVPDAGLVLRGREPELAEPSPTF